MSSPLVSVIIPTYNRASTVGRSIDSALAQSYRPLEVIVVDDGSTDETRAVLESYGDRIRPVYQPNGGPSAARNTGVAAAKGGFIAFLDSDDTWKPEKTARQARLLLEGGDNVVCCIANASLIGAGEETTTFRASGVVSGLREGYWPDPAPVLATRFILFNQVVMIRREAFEKVGGFKPEMRLLEDYDLSFRLALLGPWAFVEEPMVEKYNDTDGIGVVAMLDPVVHARSWRGVLEGFMRELGGDHPRIRKLVRRALADVVIEIRDVEAVKNGAAFSKFLARLSMAVMDKRRSLRRRLPGWPRVKAVPSLVSDNSAKLPSIPAVSAARAGQG